MELTTARLGLRKPTSDDKVWICRLNNDPLWLRFIGDKGVHTLREARGYIDAALMHHEHYGYGLCVIETRFNHVPVGVCSLTNRTLFSVPDFGIALLNEGRGQGYGVEAGEKMIEFARQTLRFDHLTAMTHKENIASQALLKKLCFRKQGQLFMPGVFPQYLFRLAL